jgi:hypothetical protein
LIPWPMTNLLDILQKETVPVAWGLTSNGGWICFSQLQLPENIRGYLFIAPSECDHALGDVAWDPALAAACNPKKTGGPPWLSSNGIH